VLGSRRRDRLRDHARRPVRAPDPTQACTKTSFCSAGGVSRPNVIDSGSRPLGTSRIVEQVWGLVGSSGDEAHSPTTEEQV
jgi:hypothetical protein